MLSFNACLLLTSVGNKEESGSIEGFLGEGDQVHADSAALSG